ncbi:hypothetical protein AAZV13_17G154900 [Glycine max]
MLNPLGKVFVSWIMSTLLNFENSNFVDRCSSPLPLCWLSLLVPFPSPSSPPTSSEKPLRLTFSFSESDDKMFAPKTLLRLPPYHWFVLLYFRLSSIYTLLMISDFLLSLVRDIPLL